MKTILVLVAIVAALPASADVADDINARIDAWHHAAATADEDVFFGTMAKGGIYLGTDATEKWTRDELRAWSEKYFDRDVAWAFKPFNRSLYFSNDGSVAWWEEYLETRFGTCRGSGVVERIDGQWMIMHYDLNVPIPNNDIDDVLRITKHPEAEAGTDEHAVMAVVRGLFNAMRDRDAAAAGELFTLEATLTRVVETDNDETETKRITAGEFMAAMGDAQRGGGKPWDERVWDVRVFADGVMASVWAPYVFYAGGETLSHCGVNSIHLIKTAEGWKISDLTYSRRGGECAHPDRAQ